MILLFSNSVYLWFCTNLRLLLMCMSNWFGAVIWFLEEISFSLISLYKMFHNVMSQIKYEAFDNTAIKLLIFPSISFNRILWESHLSMINVKKVFTHNLWVAACFYIYKTCKLAILYRCTWWWINEHHMYRYILNMTQIHCNVRPKDSKYNLIWQKTNYISLKVTLAMYFLHLWNICKKDPNVFGIVIFYINK